MAGKKKPTAKGNAKTTGAAKKTAARARTVKTDRRRSGAVNVSSHPRKTAEAALKESEQRLRTLIDAIPDAIFFKDAAGRHIIANSANEQLFGFTPEMMIGKTIEDLLPAEIAAVCRRNDDDVLKTKKIVRCEEHSLDKSGNKQILETIKVPLYDDGGNALGLVGIARDITERRKAEEALGASQKLLETIIDAAPT